MTTMKPFDLEAAKRGDPVICRNGDKARIICFDAIFEEPMIVLLMEEDEKEQLFTYNLNGKFDLNEKESSFDLFMLAETKKYFINIYKHEHDFLWSSQIHREGKVCDYDISASLLIKTIEFEIEG